MSRLASRTAAVSAALALVLALFLAPSAHAQRTSQGMDQTLGFRGIGARVGLVDPEDASSTITFGVHADLGEFIPNLRITPLAEYWSVGVSGYDHSDLMIGTNADWAFPLVGPKVTPYAGGGVGLHFISYDKPGDNYKNSRLGLHVQGGLRDEVMPNLNLFGELRFTFVRQADNFKLLGGFTYNFIY
jgi:Outer membrane protein beta-barrel domain